MMCFEISSERPLAELGTQPVDPNLWSRFRGRISYCAGEFDNPETYQKLKEALDGIREAI